MLKFLRKYKTWILVVGGTLLMIAFLLPANMNRLSLGGSGTFMTIDGRKLDMRAAHTYYLQRQAVNEVAPGMLAALGVEQEVDHWILLVKEAEAHGLVGGPQDGRDYIPELAIEVTTTALRHPLSRTSQEDMDALARTQQILTERRASAGARLRMQEHEVDQALANFRGVVRLIGMYSSAGEAVSMPRVAQEARRRLDQGIIDYVFLPATNYVHMVPDATPEEIAAHYERLRDLDPGQGEYGLGYRFGPRFQIEWLTLNRTAINAVVTVSPVDVRKTFMQETPGGTDEQFQAAKADIETRLQTAAVDRIMEVAAATVRAEIAKSLRKVESNGQYRDLPADWMTQRPNLDAISAAVVGKLIEAEGITVAPPLVNRRQDTWLTQSNMSALAGIGTAQIRRGSRTGSFSQYFMLLKELAGPNEVGLQVGVPGEALTDRQGNMYFFNITAFKPAGPADSIDEVQAQIASNLKRIAAFEKLKSEAEAYRSQAIAGGLDQVANPPEGSAAPAPLQVRTNIGVTRTDQLFMDQAINSDAVKGAIMDAVVKLDPKVDASTVDLSQRTLAIPVPERLGMAVVIIKGFNATTAEATRLLDDSLARVIGSTELREAAGADAAGGARGIDPFSLEQLAKRYKAELSLEHKNMEERRAKDEAERAEVKPTTPPKPTLTPVK